MDELQEQRQAIDGGFGPEYLSHSRVNMYLQCAQRYFLTYVEKWDYFINSAVLIGRAVDRACGAYFQEKFDSKTEMPLSGCFDAAAEELRDSRQDVNWEIEALDKVTTQKVEDETLGLVKIYHEKPMRRLQPTQAPQTPFSIELENRPYELHGYIDVMAIDESIDPTIRFVIDQKTTKRKGIWTQLRADRDRQASMYSAFLYSKGEEHVDFRFDVMVRGKQPFVDLFQTHRTAEDVERYVQLVDMVWAGIESGSFPPTDPANWWCGPKWCAHYERCKWGGSRG